MIEHFFQCPYCFEEISVLIEPYDGRQNYVEDCEVCCNPMIFDVEASAEGVHFFHVEALDQ